jgi:hypothetical protein
MVVQADESAVVARLQMGIAVLFQPPPATVDKVFKNLPG